MSLSLDELQQRHLLWKGRATAHPGQNRHTSGYAQLDTYLAGGWPDSGVIELQAERLGIGELRLILPLLQQLSANDPEGLQVWINPPARLTPYDLSWSQLRQILLLRPRHPKDALWAAEQALNSGHCNYLVLWHQGLNPAQAKRLQVAARNQNALAFVISRPTRTRQALALSMRMSLQATPQGIQLEVPKQQQGWPLPPLKLDLRARWPQLYPEQCQAAQCHFEQPDFPATAAND